MIEECGGPEAAATADAHCVGKYRFAAEAINQYLLPSPPYDLRQMLIPRKDFVINRRGTKINGTNKRKKGEYVENSEFGF